MNQIISPKEKNIIQQYLENRNPVLLFDSNTKNKCGPKIFSDFPTWKNYESYTLPPGEKNKSWRQTEKFLQFLLENNIPRKSVLINIGGGVITDLGAFAASIYKRGISFINIPTSYMAMIDASHGGKTGINFSFLKNQIGSFAFPKFVYLDIDFLNTLPKRQIKNGMVEAIKHLLLFNPNALLVLEHCKDIKEFCSQEFILNNISYKLQLVEKDVQDNNIRQQLNLGHTLGHAIESYAIKNKLNILHGEAVLIGLLMELQISENLFNTPVQIRKEIEHFKQKFYSHLHYQFELEQLFPFLLHDKKNEDAIHFSLLKNVCDCMIKVPLTLEALQNVFKI